jgi:hypothetical protein
MLHIICIIERSWEEVVSMKLTIKHKQIVILALLLVLLLIVLIQGCGNNKGKDCTAPAGSSITVTGPGLISISADTAVNYSVIVKYPDGTIMPNACVNISGAFAYPRNPSALGWLYQFYYYPDGTNDPGNVAVNSGFDAQTDDFGSYTFSAMITAGTGTFTDTITVRSGSNIGTATIGLSQ